MPTMIELDLVVKLCLASFAFGAVVSALFLISVSLKMEGKEKRFNLIRGYHGNN